MIKNLNLKLPDIDAPIYYLLFLNFTALYYLYCTNTLKRHLISKKNATNIIIEVGKLLFLLASLFIFPFQFVLRPFESHMGHVTKFLIFRNN